MSCIPLLWPIRSGPLHPCIITHDFHAPPPGEAMWSPYLSGTLGNDEAYRYQGINGPTTYKVVAFYKMGLSFSLAT